MQPYSLDQILQWPNGTPVQALVATLVGVDEPKSGTNTYGPWQIQKVGIASPSGTTVTVKLFDHDMIPSSWLNYEVLLSAGESKGKVDGLTWKQDKRGAAAGQPAPMILELKSHTGARMSLNTAQPPPAAGPPAGMAPARPTPRPGPPLAGTAPQAAPGTGWGQAPVQRPVAQPAAATAQRGFKDVLQFVGGNRTLVNLALLAMGKTSAEYEELTKKPFPRELIAPVFSSLLFGATGAGIPGLCPSGVSIKELSARLAGKEEATTPPPAPPPPQPQPAQEEQAPWPEEDDVVF